MARENLTVGRLAAFRCPPDKPQAFLWDAKVPGLALRATSNGARSFVYQSRFDRSAIRITIGSPDTWTIPAAQAEARRLQSLIDRGIDPRADRAETIARHSAARAAAKLQRQRREVSGLDAWTVYCTERARHWSERSRAEHDRIVQPGGAVRKRWSGKLTEPGPLRVLLARPLSEIDARTVESWTKRETARRPATAALGFRMLRAFLNWAAEHPDYTDIVQADACASRKARESLEKPRARSDALQREQLQAWFAAVRELQPVAAAYLQALLLTGARREELLSLQWEDVDFRWGALRIRDKVEGERIIPLTPYVTGLLAPLPRRNRWVFSSATSESGRLQEPRLSHNRALKAAGLPHLTLHGLRRSFGTLAEWVECPVGIVAQIQGHKPSAIAEKHYRVRPLDLLRMWHSKIEVWILAEAGIELPAAKQGKGELLLNVVQGAAT